MQLNRPFSTVDKQIRQLIKKGKVERRGSRKTGKPITEKIGLMVFKKQ